MSQSTPQTSSQQGQGSTISSTLSSVAQSAQSILMSFEPIKKITHHFVAMHLDTVDRTRALPVHVYTAPTSHKGLHQSLLYDSDKANARLIGIEYTIDEETFVSLPEDEKRLWHSHKDGCENGTILIGTSQLVPGAVEGIVEKELIKKLHTSYGKAIHCWHVDKTPDLPIGVPYLMDSCRSTDSLSPSLVSAYEQARGGGAGYLKQKSEERAKYLDRDYKVKPGCDASCSASGKAPEFVAVQTEVKKGQAGWKGKGEIC